MPTFNGYTISDNNAIERADTFDEAVELIADWYADIDQWGDGHGDEVLHASVRQAIDSVAKPTGGDIADLQTYAGQIDHAVAVAMGHKSFDAHGNYHVSACDSAGLCLTVELFVDPAGPTPDDILDDLMDQLYQSIEDVESFASDVAKQPATDERIKAVAEALGLVNRAAQALEAFK